MDFIKTYTNKILEHRYGQQYIQLSSTERKQFYENLDYDVQMDIKIHTTNELGLGFNRLTLNDQYNFINFKHKNSVQHLFQQIMEAFMSKEVQFSNQQNDLNEIDDDPLYKIQKQAFNSFKQKLFKRVLPPSGVSVVCFIDGLIQLSNFAVMQTFDVRGFLSRIAELRIQYKFRQLFPVQMLIGDQEQVDDQEQVKVANTPRFSQHTTINEDQLQLLNIQYINARRRVKIYLLDQLQQQIDKIMENEIFNIKKLFYILDTQQEDALLQYFLDIEYCEERDEMLTGWLIINEKFTDQINLEQNLFQKENLFNETMLHLLDLICKQVDQQLFEVIKLEFGERFLNGW